MSIETYIHHPDSEPERVEVPYSEISDDHLMMLVLDGDPGAVAEMNQRETSPSDS